MKPNLFIVGAAKSGTTTLYERLSLSNEIFMAPIKEPHYYCYAEWVNRYYYKEPIIGCKDEYMKLFAGAPNECKYAGEATVHYLPSLVAANNIYKDNPSSRIIIILRNPVDRAFSHYLMDNSKLDNGVMSGADYSFDEILTSDKSDCVSLRREYLELGNYGDQLERFMSIFPRDQLFVTLYEELFTHGDEMFKSMCNFLGINYVRKNSSKDRLNVYSEPSSRILKTIYKNRRVRMALAGLTPAWLSHGLKKLVFSDVKPRISDRSKCYLEDYYFHQIRKANDLLGGRLNHWCC